MIFVIIGVGLIRYVMMYGLVLYVVDKIDCEVDMEIYLNVKVVNFKSSGGIFIGTIFVVCVGVM